MQITIRTAGNKKSPFSSGALFILVMLLMTSFQITGCQNPNAAAPPPPAEVEVAAVSQKDVPIYSEWVATLNGYVNAQISPQVSGYIIAQDYKEGSFKRSWTKPKHSLPNAKLSRVKPNFTWTGTLRKTSIAVESGVKWRLT